MKTLFVLGHPGLYGGAGTELHHQILLWRSMGVNVTIIPSMLGFQNEPLFEEMKKIGVQYADRPRDYSQVTSEDAVINFCGREFLEDIDQIYERTQRTAFVNCMTWMFPKEKEAHAKGKIAFSLYQRPQVRDEHQAELGKLNPNAKFLHFVPYFESSKFPFKAKEKKDRFVIGRISRQDADKFSKNTFHIWEYAVAPIMKRGIVLGFDKKSRLKTGNPPGWVETYVDHNEFPVHRFYREIDILVQSTDTNENWPRIGFEAMYSGIPLVVDNRAGWKYMIEHGVSGFLCDHERDFIYWTSRLAYEPDLRDKIREGGLLRAKELSSAEVSKRSWQQIFDEIFQG